MEVNTQEILVKLVEQDSQNGILEILNGGGGTVIASLLTVIATLLAVTFTNNHNKKLEAKKIKREKLEEIHRLVYYSGFMFLTKREIAIYLNLNDLQKHFSKFFDSKSRIEILVNSYFNKELKYVSNNYLVSLELVFKALKLRFEKEVIDDLYLDLKGAQDNLSLAGYEYSELMNYDQEDEFQGPVIEEALIYENEVKKADQELGQINARLEWNSKDFEKTKKTLEEKGNPDVDKLIDEMILLRKIFLEEIVDQVQNNIK